MTISAVLAVIGTIPVLRFLIFWMSGTAMWSYSVAGFRRRLSVLAGITSVALLADLMAANRRLLEMTWKGEAMEWRRHVKG
ncbi:MAG: hypothetical protein R3C20_01915 [Planctomycetaceae bacterium]